ncbi:MAG: hypothetical protein NTU53_15115 [Planctomycetota bacterium]|nr:hypothetical protein [Planctomycetota bacterium]
MKWIKPKKSSPNVNANPSCETHDAGLSDDYSDNFNAPLSEQRGGTTTEMVRDADAVEEDRADVAEAERRLSDPNDRTLRFRPSR